MKANLKTLSVRIRDKHSKVLGQMAFECNQIWNHVNAEKFDYATTPIPEVGITYVYLSAFDMAKGVAKLRNERGYTIHSQTAQEVTEQHEKSCKQFKKSKLRWRVSGGSRKSLGWIPFKRGACKFVNGQVRYAGHHFKIWDSYGLSKYDLRSGSFSEDSRGRWYFNAVVECAIEPSTGTTSVGIDLGLKTTATCSDGVVLDRKERYRASAEKLGKAQRARKKGRVKAIHAKIKNQRKDDNHKFSTMLVKRHGAIFVGDVNSSALVKTKMAKSVLDAGWFQLKTFLSYKAIAHSVLFEVVNEKYSTQTCSCCGVISDNSPKGRAGLAIREWTCPDCGTKHDRDVNAAMNILAVGHDRLAVGIPTL